MFDELLFRYRFPITYAGKSVVSVPGLKVCCCCTLMASTVIGHSTYPSPPPIYICKTAVIFPLRRSLARSLSRELPPMHFNGVTTVHPYFSLRMSLFIALECWQLSLIGVRLPTPLFHPFLFYYYYYFRPNNCTQVTTTLEWVRYFCGTLPQAQLWEWELDK